ncbi:MAG: CHAT domain-containing tetratricopeptide repeat protein [Bacillota bacterium]
MDDYLNTPLGEISALLDRGKPEAALRAIERFEQRFRTKRDAATELWLDVARGRALSQLSEYERAEATLLSARERFASMGEAGGYLRLAGLAASDAALGEMYHRKTEFRRAIECFERAIAEYQEATSRFGIQFGLQTGLEKARVQVMMAESLMSCGEFGRAIALCDEAKSVFSSHGDLAWRGRAEKAAGTVLWYQDRFDEALARYERAQADFALTGMDVQAAFVDNNRALIYWKINQPSEAVRLFERARPVIAEAGMATEVATIDVNTSIALTSLGRNEEALELLDRAGAAFASMGVHQKAAWVDYYKGKILAESGRHREAIDLFARARARFADQAIDTYRAQASLYLGLCHLELGEPGDARAACRDALDVATARDVPDLAFPALYGLARATEPDDPAGALDFYKKSIHEIERMRQSLAEDRLKTSFVFDKTQVYDAAVALAVKLERYREALALVERAKSQALIDAFRGAAGNERGTALHPRGAGDSQISFITNTILGGGHADAVLEYYLLPDRLFFFVLTNEGIEKVKVCAVGVARSELQDLIAWLYADLDIMQTAGRDFVAANIRQLLTSCNDHARAIYDVLVAPVEEHIAGRRRLLIVPHGPLHHVPFHALYDGNRYIIDRHEVFVTPSMGVLEAVWEKDARTPQTCLAIATQDRDAPLATRECQAVAALFGPGKAKLLLGEEATAAAVTAAAPGCDVIHFAGHGVFDPENPMHSHLRLSGGTLSALDIFHMRLDSDLVVLSACETGVAHVASGDELLGLSRGLFHAGVSSLVVSLWRVNDASTAQLAVRFYRALLAGKPKPQALRDAALFVKARLGHPYYWAPFVLVGDPRKFQRAPE